MARDALLVSGLTGEVADVFAWRSECLYQWAKASGFCKGEVVTVTVSLLGKKPDVLVCEDEHSCVDVSSQGLAQLAKLCAQEEHLLCF